MRCRNALCLVLGVPVVVAVAGDGTAVLAAEKATNLTVIAVCEDRATLAVEKATNRTVCEDGSEKTVLDATVLTYQHSLYLGLGGDSPIGGVKVTPSVRPPAGVTLKLREIPWSKIKRISWAPAVKRVYHAPATITYVDGTTEETLLWREKDDALRNFQGLGVSGTMILDGHSLEVTVWGPFKTLTFQHER